MIKPRFLLLLLTVSTCCFGQKVNEYGEVIKKTGEDPVRFVQQKLETHDLILFDDGLHSAFEPFVFYRELISAPNTKLDYVFIEVLGLNSQPYIDAFLNSKTRDKNLLSKVFQDDFSGLGWRYETYLDLLSTVWEVNHRQTDEKKKIKVIGVDQPVYWEGIHTRQDYDIFLKSHIARDYFMYRTITEQMDNFNSGKKGIFLSNTRHVYKNIRNSKDVPYWNSGTFFYRWHPGKTYAIRIHNVMLSITAADQEKKNLTSQGLDHVKYSWISPEKGIWEEAFKLNQNRPVAFSLKDNPFGRATYIGNHMLHADPTQTMYDAYDALIFLAPLDTLHFSAKMNFFYTGAFKKELKRRIKIIYGENLDTFLKNHQAKTIDEFIDNLTKYQSKAKNELLNK